MWTDFPGITERDVPTHPDELPGMSLAGPMHYLYHWFGANDGYFEWAVPPPTSDSDADVDCLLLPMAA